MDSVVEPTTAHHMTAPKTGTRRRLYIPRIVVLLGIAASSGTFPVLHRNEKAQIDAEFRRRAQGIANLMAEALQMIFLLLQKKGSLKTELSVCI